MEISISSKTLFPDAVETLLYSLSRAGFFSHGLMAGSWVFSVYREAFDINYYLKTFDIDFVVDVMSSGQGDYVDLESVLTGLGYIPLTDYLTGLQKFSKEGFEVEFLVHRKGGIEKDKEDVKRYNITALPLPFIDMLFNSAVTVNLENYQIRIPCPEALFLHKLIISQRRKSVTKKENDLAQCKVLKTELDLEKLNNIISSLKFSSKTLKSIVISCEAIDFPPHLLQFQ